METITAIEPLCEMRPGGAIYQIIDEGDGNFLLGLGLWDRANVKHTRKIKDATPGQVVRVDSEDNVTARSPELSNIIYQLMPVDNQKIFVGCRSGELAYLNREDLTLNRHLDFNSTGLYFWLRDGNTLVATMREGAVLFYDLETDAAEVLPVVDPKVRMWPIVQDGERLVTGSYRGDLALIKDREVTKRTNILGGGAAWTLDVFADRYLVGTAKGKVIAYDRNLENPEIVFQNETAITATAIANDQQMIIADLDGNIHVWNGNGNVISHMHPTEEKVKNTVWWVTLDHQNRLMRAAYSNGQMKTFGLGG